VHRLSTNSTIHGFVDVWFHLRWLSSGKSLGKGATELREVVMVFGDDRKVWDVHAYVFEGILTGLWLRKMNVLFK
jgi:hypothetical protein